ncbi:hypothetical protein MPTK1_6g16530 [Marchantia polymorpha subsp. ruderalis]|uniref:Uncharacterized protein n=2 Tax=Marchantia polymorpha TaxID=3197 RepID=A0AAF6BSR3_MARPO|nr:hypothetical protein MARPO_0170s0024 [Marchantia polymorpha]BBN15047.1 hypothetical protein Mp_6g16530 [Marchantia polymorpha subsp. ruderalis]|eukprot:PTQ28220.1 hypothetical protein MARPO_0170s0024 [Marchantia polymorpha]
MSGWARAESERFCSPRSPFRARFPADFTDIERITDYERLSRRGGVGRGDRRRQTGQKTLFPLCAVDGGGSDFERGHKRIWSKVTKPLTDFSERVALSLFFSPTFAGRAVCQRPRQRVNTCLAVDKVQGAEGPDVCLKTASRVTRAPRESHVRQKIRWTPNFQLRSGTGGVNRKKAGEE